jgi:hypothetical protein
MLVPSSFVFIFFLFASHLLFRFQIDNNDGLSTVACESCREKVFMFDDFAVNCKAAQKILVKLKGEIEPINEIIAHYSNEGCDGDESLMNVKIEELDPITDVNHFADQVDQSDDDYPLIEESMI